MEIRPAGAADLLGIFTVVVRTWQSAYAGIVPADQLAAMTPEARLARFHERFPDYPDDFDGQDQVATVGEQVVGFVRAGAARGDLPSGFGEIVALYVLPEHQGSGVGSGLMRRALTRLREQELDPVVLWVFTANQPARAFYERHGFVPDGGSADWDAEGTPIPELRYRRDT